MKTVLITGGSRGIGAATAMLAAEQGYNVIITYVENKTAAEAVAGKTGAKVIQCDIGDYNSIINLYDKAGPIDAVVNNAGITIGAAPISYLDHDKLQRLISVNSIGTLLSCKEAVNKGVSSIVNVSSMASSMGGRPGSIPYSASKAAVDSMTVGLARELKTVRVNAVRPGYTLTDLTKSWTDDPEVYLKNINAIPMGRPANPDEVANVIMWLLSEEARYVSGSIVDVSGGGYTIAGGHK